MVFGFTSYTRLGPILGNKEIKLQILWHLLLTVCSGSSCLEQDIQWFENKQSCEIIRTLYIEIPTDGDWDTVNYVCKPINSVGT